MDYDTALAIVRRAAREHSRTLARDSQEATRAGRTEVAEDLAARAADVRLALTVTDTLTDVERS